MKKTIATVVLTLALLVTFLPRDLGGRWMAQPREKERIEQTDSRMDRDRLCVMWPDYCGGWER